MDWIKEYQLFLLDFDGLLVNTEHLHFEAYRRMCKGRGLTLPWTFAHFFEIAQQDSKLLQIKIYEELPALYEQESTWSVLYAEKKKQYLEVLKETQIEMMPGAESFLQLLEKNNIKRVVVTHSPKEQIDLIRERNPILNTIPHWITREDYQHAKPHPEPYLVALKRFASSSDNVIGFEDSQRGIASLIDAHVQPVLINPKIAENLKPLIINKKIFHFPSLQIVVDQKMARKPCKSCSCKTSFL